MSRTISSVAVAALASLSLVACSGSGGSTNPTDSTGTRVKGPRTSNSVEVDSGDASVGFNDDDVMFAQMMIPHHEQAVELADLALDPARGAGADVLRLAAQIKAAQAPELEEIKSLLASWGESEAMGHNMGRAGKSGMLSDREVTRLGELTGADFDKAWLDGMIGHHEGAIRMAEDVVDRGVDADLRALASAIIDAQQAEVDEMKALLD